MHASFFSMQPARSSRKRLLLSPASVSLTTGMDATGYVCVCKGMRSYAVLAFVCVRMCVCMRDWLCGSRPTRPACERGRLCETGLRDGLRDRPFFPQQAGPACEGLRGPHAFAMVESIWPLNCKVRFMFELNVTAS